MNDFLFVLNQLLIDFIKKSPNRVFAKLALWTYTTFKHFNNPVILRFNNLKDLDNALSKNRILYKYKGCNCYLQQLMRHNNTNGILRGVWDITNFFKQSWPPVIRDQIYDDLRLYLRLGGVIIYQG